MLKHDVIVSRCLRLNFRMTKAFYSTTKINQIVFDYKAKTIQRNRFALIENPYVYDYIRKEVAYRLADRVADILRKFHVAVDLGCGRGYLSQYLTCNSIGTLYQIIDSPLITKQILPSKDVQTSILNFPEYCLPFRPNSVDLVLSSLSLHWINDLPRILSQILACLRPDGCFIGVMPALDTLFELRISLQLAEMERKGGLSSHISPFVDAVDMAELLQHTGFNLISLDVENIVIHYPDMFALMKDLQCMGESNAALQRPLHLSRDVLLAASSIYDEKFGKLRQGKDNGERCIPATYRMLHFIGWKPHPSQKKPLPRGSAQYSLKDLDKIDEIIKNLDDSKNLK